MTYVPNQHCGICDMVYCDHPQEHCLYSPTTFEPYAGGWSRLLGQKYPGETVFDYSCRRCNASNGLRVSGTNLTEVKTIGDQEKHRHVCARCKQPNWIAVTRLPK